MMEYDEAMNEHFDTACGNLAITHEDLLNKLNRTTTKKIFLKKRKRK